MDTETEKQFTSVPSERAPQLRPYHFKPGQSGNPKGRPPEKLSKHERLVILSEIAKHEIESAVSAGHKIAAIREANLMEHVYQSPIDTNINITFVIGRGYKEVPQVVEGTAKLITDGNDRADTPGD